MKWIGKSVSAPSNLLWWYLFCSCGAILVYFFGLDSQYIPKNGDEYVYAHITRLTAQSQHLLPSSAETQGMGNTKPPLLFWQGLISTRWAQAWTLTRLRWPNTMYTLLTAVLIGVWSWKIANTMGSAGSRRGANLETGFTAALTYLAFFSTYRYGRPFLTNSPEVFWVTVCFSPVLWRALTPRTDLISWPSVIVSGCAAGLVSLYKSFALLAPIEFALLWWCLHRRHYRWRDVARQDLPWLVCIAAIALSIFALWFVLSPDPQAVRLPFRPRF